MKGNFGTLDSTLNGLTFDRKMPRHPNGQPMARALDEGAGIFNENGDEYFYVLDLLDENGNSLKKIIYLGIYEL